MSTSAAPSSRSKRAPPASAPLTTRSRRGGNRGGGYPLRQLVSKADFVQLITPLMTAGSSDSSPSKLAIHGGKDCVGVQLFGGIRRELRLCGSCERSPLDIFQGKGP